jgi:hypothetical protein
MTLQLHKAPARKQLLLLLLPRLGGIICHACATMCACQLSACACWCPACSS